MAAKQVPDSIWKAYAERTHTACAFVDRHDYFRFANSAFEELVGYSMAELQELRWQDITVNEDIGADQRNVQAILSGADQSYQMRKHYRHKSGHALAIVLTVWRHYSTSQAEVWMIAEVVPEHATNEQISTIYNRLAVEMKAMQQRIDRIEGRSMKKEHGHNTNVNVGDRNSQDVIKWLVVGLIALASAVAYMSYIGGWRDHGGKAKPPTIEMPTD